MAITRLDSEVSESTAYFQFEPRRDPMEGASPIGRFMSWAYLYSDQSASIVSIHIPVETRVLRVYHEVDTAFTGVSAVVVGDADADDNWIVTGVITPGTAGDFVCDYDSANAVKGKYYEDGGTLLITFTGIASAGAGKVFIEVISYHEDKTVT